jgi:putative tryptophan/tyrosine transport system substrate-binding protein
MPVIGFLRSTTPADATEFVTAFRQGLKDTGYVEGQNVAIEFRWAEGRTDRLPALVDELIHWPVDLIVGDAVAMLAAKCATTSVPIVFAAGGDPVGEGLVASLNRPGGNVTGVHFFGGVLGAKRLELLRQLLPKAGTIAMLVYPNTPNTEANEATCRPQRRCPGRNKSFWMSATTEKWILPLQHSSSTGPAPCSSVQVLSRFPIGNGWSRWRLAMRCPRPIISKSSPALAA